MTVHAKHCVRIGPATAIDRIRPDDTGDMFNVYLVKNAHAWWNYANIFKCLLSPLYETIALAVPFVFKRHISLQSVRTPVIIDIDRVIDHEVDRQARIDLCRIATKVMDRITHCRQVDQ